jgi:hypothetical protein
LFDALTVNLQELLHVEQLTSLGVTREALDDLVADCLRVLGAGHPSMFSISALTQSWPRSPGERISLRAEEQLGADCARVLGPDHPTTPTLQRRLDARRAESMPLLYDNPSWRWPPPGLPFALAALSLVVEVDVPHVDPRAAVDTGPRTRPRLSPTLRDRMTTRRKNNANRLQQLGIADRRAPLDNVAGEQTAASKAMIQAPPKLTKGRGAIRSVSTSTHIAGAEYLIRPGPTSV